MSEPRYHVRRVRPEDGDALHAIFSDPTVYGGTLQMPHPAVGMWRERAAGTPDVTTLVACTGIDAGSPIVGQLGLHTTTRPRRAHAAAFGMGVPVAWQGKGVGSALMHALIDLADNWYGLARLELEVFVDNAAAIALYRKFGFEHEGTLRAHSLRGGALVDVHAMARVRARPQPATLAP